MWAASFSRKRIMGKQRLPRRTTMSQQFKTDLYGATKAGAQ
jgi:hypothetical protein